MTAYEHRKSTLRLLTTGDVNVGSFGPIATLEGIPIEPSFYSPAGSPSKENKGAIDFLECVKTTDSREIWKWVNHCSLEAQPSIPPQPLLVRGGRVPTGGRAYDEVFDDRPNELAPLRAKLLDGIVSPRTAIICRGALIRMEQARGLLKGGMQAFKTAAGRGRAQRQELEELCKRLLKYSAALGAYQLQVAIETKQVKSAKARKQNLEHLLSASFRNWRWQLELLYRGLDLNRVSVKLRAVEACRKWLRSTRFLSRLRRLAVISPLAVNGYLAREPLERLPPTVVKGIIERICRTVIAEWQTLAVELAFVRPHREAWDWEDLSKRLDGWIEYNKCVKEFAQRIRRFAENFLMAFFISIWRHEMAVVLEDRKRRIIRLQTIRCMMLWKQILARKRRVAEFTSKWMVDHEVQDAVHEGELLNEVMEIWHMWTTAMSFERKSRIEHQLLAMKLAIGSWARRVRHPWVVDITNERRKTESLWGWEAAQRAHNIWAAKMRRVLFRKWLFVVSICELSRESSSRDTASETMEVDSCEAVVNSLRRILTKLDNGFQDPDPSSMQIDTDGTELLDAEGESRGQSYLAPEGSRTNPFSRNSALKTAASRLGGINALGLPTGVSATLLEWRDSVLDRLQQVSEDDPTTVQAQAATDKPQFLKSVHKHNDWEVGEDRVASNSLGPACDEDGDKLYLHHLLNKELFDSYSLLLPSEDQRWTSQQEPESLTERDSVGSITERGFLELLRDAAVVPDSVAEAEAAAVFRQSSQPRESSRKSANLVCMDFQGYKRAICLMTRMSVATQGTIPILGIDVQGVPDQKGLLKDSSSHRTRCTSRSGWEGTLKYHPGPMQQGKLLVENLLAPSVRGLSIHRMPAATAAHLTHSNIATYRSAMAWRKSRAYRPPRCYTHQSLEAGGVEHEDRRVQVSDGFMALAKSYPLDSDIGEMQHAFMKRFSSPLAAWAFLEISQDGTDILRKTEISQGLRRLGLGHLNVNSIISVLDRRSSGKISLHDFLDQMAWDDIVFPSIQALMDELYQVRLQRHRLVESAIGASDISEMLSRQMYHP